MVSLRYLYSALYSDTNMFLQGKSGIPSGPKPVNLLQNDKKPRDQQSKPEWHRPGANAHAGLRSSQMPQSTPQYPNKRQRTERHSSYSNSSPQSPIDLDHDSLGRQRHGSMARSGQSQTVNEPPNNTGRGEVKEFRSTEDITKPPRSGRPRPRNSSSSDGHMNGNGTQKYKSTVVRLDDLPVEDPADPVYDSDLDAGGRQPFHKRSVPEVQIPNYEPARRIFTRQNPAENNKSNDSNGMNRRNKELFPSALETPLASPHFKASDSNAKDLRSSNALSTVKRVSAGGSVQAKHPAGRASRGKALSRVDSESSPDQLQYDPKDYEGMAQKLLAGDKTYDMERPQSRCDSINLVDSDDELAQQNADIAPTVFGSEHKPKHRAGLESGTYEICQLFCHEKMWLNSTDKKSWTLRHDRDKRLLQAFNENDISQQKFLSQKFDFFEWDGASTKVVIHRHREGLRKTQIYVEFSSLKQREIFIREMISAYKIRAFPKDM